MNDKMMVVAKMDGDRVLYLKAKPCADAGGDPVVPEPEVGKRYFFAGLITSLVRSFEKAADGLRVETENSVYLCWIDTTENASVFAKSKSLPDHVEHTSGSIYWGFDNRLSTYIL